MSDNMQQEQAPEQQGAQYAGVPTIANPTETLKQNSEKLAKFGGFDLIEACVEGAQNLNPERKARKNIFLGESGKKGERETLKRTLELWSEVLQSNSAISDMVNSCDKKSEECTELLKNNLAKAVEETKDLERSYRSVGLFFKNTEGDKLKNVSFMNCELDQLKDLDNTRFIDAVSEELKMSYDRLDLRNNYSIMCLPGYLGSNKVVEK